MLMTAFYLLTLLIIAHSILFSFVQSNDEPPYVKGTDKNYHLVSRDYKKLNKKDKDYVNRMLKVSAIFNVSVLGNIQDIPDNNLLVNILDLQKTGSTSLNEIFIETVSTEKHIAQLLLVPGVKSYKNFHCVNHADVEHVVDCVVRNKDNSINE